MKQYIGVHRRQRGFTIAELARRADLSRTTIHALERDPSYVPSGYTLTRLAAALEMEIPQMFTGPNEQDDPRCDAELAPRSWRYEPGTPPEPMSRDYPTDPGTPPAVINEHGDPILEVVGCASDEEGEQIAQIAAAAPNLLEIVQDLLIKPGVFAAEWYVGHAQGCPPPGWSKDHPDGSWGCSDYCKWLTAVLTQAGRPPR